MFDNELVSGKLKRWGRFLEKHSLPEWNSIPNYGLYMDQVVALLTEYLEFLPPELRDDQLITPAAINNYVRLGMLPEPERKRYYRIHMAYLIMISSLKTTLSLSRISQILPATLSAEEFEAIYNSFVKRHMVASKYFIDRVKEIDGKILGKEEVNELQVEDTLDLIFFSTGISTYSKILAEKLILLDGKNIENGGSIE